MTLSNAKNAYREAAIRSASEVQLVVMMYDMLIEDIRRAITTLTPDQPEQRCNEVKHCVGVLEQLQGNLDMKRGGETARNLDRLYSIVRGKLLEAHLKRSESLFRAQMALISELREAWHLSEIQLRANHPTATVSQISTTAHPENGERQNVSQWSA